MSMCQKTHKRVSQNARISYLFSFSISGHQFTHTSLERQHNLTNNPRTSFCMPKHQYPFQILNPFDN